MGSPFDHLPAESAQLRFGALLAGAPRPFTLPSLLTLDDRVQQVLARAREVRGLKETTCRWAADGYRSLRRFLREQNAERSFLGGDPRVQVLLLQQWVGWMRRSCGSVAVNTFWRGAASIFRWIAEEDGMVSPFLYVAAPKFARLSPAFLPRDRAERLLLTVANMQWPTPLARTRNTAIVALMLLAGLRRAEVLRLRVADVDLENSRLLIRGAKGMHGGRDRTGWIAPQLGTILERYLAERARARPTRSHPELVTSLRANARVGFGTTQRLFQVLSRAMDCRVTPHMLRHSYATLLRQSNVPDRIAMELLGHTSLAMLQRYSHVENGETARAAAQLRLSVDV